MTNSLPYLAFERSTPVDRATDRFKARFGVSPMQAFISGSYLRVGPVLTDTHDAPASPQPQQQLTLFSPEAPHAN